MRRCEAALPPPTFQRDRFNIGILLGAGTFGEVYLARLQSVQGIEQDVAVKLLNPGLDARSQPVSRMRDEGRLLAGLNHPAILQVMDFCHLDGRIGLVTEYVPGADLDDCIHGDDPIPARAALQVIGQVADALHAAFESRTTDGGTLGLVHRDVKPANIRVTPHGSVKLLDFGIAKSDDLNRETTTQQKVAFGTPAYMAPEVLSYEILTALPSRDVFALGCTLYEALTRERFFHGLDQTSIGRTCNKEDRFREWRAQRLARLKGQDAEVVALVATMLSYAHTERPSAREVAEQSLHVADRLSGPALWSWARQRRWPEVAHSSGPWTGRVIVDTHVDPTVDDSGRMVDPGGLASVLASGDGGWNVPGGPPPEPPIAQLRGRGEASARHQRPLETLANRGESSAAYDAPLAPLPTSGIGPLHVAAGAVFVVAAALLVVLLVVLVRPDLVAQGVGGARDPIARAARRAAAGGEAADTAEPVPASGGAGSTQYGWGAKPEGATETASVLLQGEGDVIVTRPGRRPIQVPPWGYVRIEAGPIEVEARFEGRGRYERQFGTVVGGGDTVSVSCDASLRRCDRR